MGRDEGLTETTREFLGTAPRIKQADPGNKEPRDSSVMAGEACGVWAVSAKGAQSSAHVSARLEVGREVSFHVGHPGALKAKAAVCRQTEGQWALPSLASALVMCSSHLAAVKCLCVYLLHQADFQGHNHDLGIIPLYSPFDTDPAHRRSAIDVKLMNSLRNLFSQRDVQGF